MKLIWTGFIDKRPAFKYQLRRFGSVQLGFILVPTCSWNEGGGEISNQVLVTKRVTEEMRKDWRDMKGFTLKEKDHGNNSYNVVWSCQSRRTNYLPLFRHNIDDDCAHEFMNIGCHCLIWPILMFSIVTTATSFCEGITLLIISGALCQRHATGRDGVFSPCVCYFYGMHWNSR